MTGQIQEWGFIIAKNTGCDPLVVHVSKDPEKDTLKSMITRLSRRYEHVNLFAVINDQRSWSDFRPTTIKVDGKDIEVAQLR